VLNTNFWLYWRTMFAFENWHSALEMKLYLQRYIHHIGGLPDFTALRFTKYNQYESMILPMANIWRSTASSSITAPRSSMWSSTAGRNGKLARKIDCTCRTAQDAIDLTENDLVFITNGGCVENSTYGSQTPPATVHHRI
jgi:oleate hydratase